MDPGLLAVNMHEPTISSVQADPLIMPKDVLKELQQGFRAQQRLKQQTGWLQALVQDVSPEK